MIEPGVSDRSDSLLSNEEQASDSRVKNKTVQSNSFERS